MENFIRGLHWYAMALPQSVLHVLPHIGAGGAERVFLTLFEHQVRLGLSARVFFMAEGGRTTDSRLGLLPSPVFLGAPQSNLDFRRFRASRIRLAS